MTKEDFLEILSWNIENKNHAYEIKRSMNGIPNLIDYVKCGDLLDFIEKLVDNDESGSKK